MTGIDFDCPSCATTHCGTDGTRDRPWPALVFRRPDAYLDLSPQELRHSDATDDACWIARPDRTDFFVRAMLPMPIHEDPLRRLDYEPWVRLDEDDFVDILDHVEDDAYRAEYAGRLATALPGYGDTDGVPVLVRSQGHLRPLVVPDPAVENPLVHDLREGIAREEAELRIRSFLLR